MSSRLSSFINMLLGYQSLDWVPEPTNFNIFWNFGSLLGLCLTVQVVSGIFLAMHYSPQVDLAFYSCVHITREVNFGWFVRSLHANGASFFFLFMYIHIGRGLYYGSFRIVRVWLLGVLLFILTMAAAFLGYVLVWGQMSLWAATVITSLLSAIPLCGTSLVEWIWGGFSVSDATLHRFFVFHFIIPFILIVLTLMHMYTLHNRTGSSNPLGLDRELMPSEDFEDFCVDSDFMTIMLSIFFYLLVVLGVPFLFSEPENFIPANPLVTPNHIKPEWYFLWLYAILRAIPNKLGGVLALFMGILFLAFLPFMISIVSVDPGARVGMGFSCLSKVFFWFFIVNFFLLTWLGSCPAEEPYNFSAQLCSLFYFSFFFLFSFWVWCREVYSGLSQQD